MRIRSIKPEFWRSADITGLSLEDRLLFIGLWSYVDDNGVGRDELPVIVADLFAGDMFADSRETIARVSRGLSNLFSTSLIDRYEVDGKAYLMICKWDKHQRIDKPAKERFPRSDGTLEVVREQFATPSRESRDTLAPGTGEQGNRGTGDQGTGEQAAPTALEVLFDDAYSHWPKKTERKQSLAKFKIAARKIQPDLLAQHVKRFGDAYAATTERNFVPALSVWLGNERWNDDLPQAREIQRPLTNMDHNLAYVRSLMTEQSSHQFEIEGAA